jgi:quercetin dioxygenase-like cupin family protein
MAGSDRNAGPEKGRGVVKRADVVERCEVAAGRATQTQLLLGPEDGMPNFSMRRFSMGEAGGMPRHTNSVEHEQFVLRGRAEVGIGDEVHEVEAGDVLYIPAGVPHYYSVVEAPFEFLCMVPNSPDRVEILE